MKKKLIVAGIIASGLSIISIFARRRFTEEKDSSPRLNKKIHKMEVIKIDGVWRVIREDDPSNSDVEAERGDIIKWKVSGSEAKFEFSERQIFGITKLRTFFRRAKGDVLTNCPLGTYTYEVFVNRDNVYAVGQSPPRIIIK